MEKVVLLKCDSYDVKLLENKLREGFNLLGGEEYLKKHMPPGSRVLLKPNMLSVEEAESPVVTNYKLFEAVIRIIKDLMVNGSYTGPNSNNVNYLIYFPF
jgi:uncharacterized protein (DUF362 family)